MLDLTRTRLESKPRAGFLRTDHLYPLLTLAWVTAFISLLPLPPHDFWWHMRVGQIVAEQGQVPKTNMFAWTLPSDTPYVYGAWMGGWLFYVLHSIGNLELVIFMRNFLALVSFSLIGLEARRRSGSWRLAGLAIALAGTVTVSAAIVRTQMWSWLPFALYLLILRRYADRQIHGFWLVVLPLIMPFWVNVHGAFVLGIVLIGGTVVGEVLRRILDHPGALSWREISLLVLTGTTAVLATLLNPLGTGVFAYVRDLLTDQPSQGLIEDWASPTPSGPINLTFFASTLLLLVAFAYTRRRPAPTDVLLTCAFLWLAWTGQRYLVWYGMVAMPVLAEALAGMRKRSPILIHPAQSPLLNRLITTVLIVSVLIVQPWTVQNLPLPAQIKDQIHAPPAPPLLSTRTPLGATEFLRANPGGRVFNDMGYGSYLIWALPEQPVFIDTRVELYPFQQWLDYISISNGIDSEELLKRYGVDRVLLSLKEQGGLSEALAEAPGWEREYADRYSEVWRYGDDR